MLKLTNLGHACFLIEDETRRLVIDPYDDATGYPPLRIRANMLLMSHGHHDHNFEAGVELVPGKNFPFETIDTFHDGRNGSQRGPNKVFVIEAGGLRLCHMGDLGHIPSKVQYDAIGKIDILMIPVGGYYTVDAAEAAEIVGHIAPGVVIPMHYNPGGLNNPISGVEPFLEIMKEWDIVRADLEGRSELIVAEELPKMRIEVLKMPL